jgi:hypothetical protein
MASASATDTNAIKRALLNTDMPLAIAICRSSGRLAKGPVVSQNRASSVCRGVRLTLFFSPISLISS